MIVLAVFQVEQEAVCKEVSTTEGKEEGTEVRDSFSKRVADICQTLQILHWKAMVYGFSAPQ